MKTRAIMITLILVLLTATAWAGEVCQGRLISAGQAPAVFTIEEYDTNFGVKNPYGVPTGIINRYDVSAARIGIPPEPGDILRIAYEENGETRRAIKVMNVSKQDLRKK
jgi:hypothetical protein